MTVAAFPQKAQAGAEWWVQVREQAYGPYSMAQLSHFVAEGRINATTQVSDKPNRNWRNACGVVGLMDPTSIAANDSVIEAANIFVHAEIVSGSWISFMAALESMGAVCALAPGLWLVRTRHSAGKVRNTLNQTMEKRDRFVVIDASRDRLAWYNLGLDADMQIGKVWNGPLRGETC